jgi:hypothetical protein
MDFSRNKTMMGVVAVLLLLFVAAIFFYNRTLNDLAASSCTEDASICPHAKVVDTQNLVIGVLVFVVAIMAGWLLYNAYFAKAAPAEAPRAAPAAQAGQGANAAQGKKRKIAAASLDSDEARVVAFINEGNGSVYQSDILKKTGFSKVKVSRLLDKLEQKGLLERKRRGMTNLVVAK